MPKSSIVRKQTIDWRLDGRYANLTAQQALQHGGRMIVDEIRKGVPPPKGRGAFPGYAARGTLAAAVQSCRKPRTITPHVYACTIDINRASPAIVYAHVHEYGMTIYPRRARLLVFRNEQGELVFARSVYIRPKHFFSRGVSRGVLRIQRELPPYFVNLTSEKRWPSK